MRIDLHGHSTASDGTLAPAAYVALARASGVTHLGLTDHDTTLGLAEAMRAAAPDVEIVPGIELTATFHGREIHLLGHFVDPDAQALAGACAAAAAERETRLARMVERLAAAGVNVRFEHVLEEAAGGTLARPHLARTLVRYGHAASMQEAFDRFLSRGTPGWVDRQRPEAKEAIAVIHAAGGTAAIAHPGVNGISRHELADLAALGLDAAEAYHPNHPATQAEAYVRWGRALGLRATGGTDFHGGGPEAAPPGTVTTPPEELEALRAVAAGRARLTPSPHRQ